MNFCGCCSCWGKRERGGFHASVDTAENPSTNRLVDTVENPSTDLPVDTAKNPPKARPDRSIDLPVDTAKNPSTDPLDRSTDLPVDVAEKPSLSTTSVGPSFSKKPPPTLEDVRDSLQKVDIGRLDDFINVIRQRLERVAPQKDTQDIASSSSPNKDKFPVWTSPIVQSGRKFLSFVNDHSEKIDNKDEFFNSGEAAKIAGNILQQAGQIHWAVAALSITGYLISKCQKVSQNHTEYIELLKKMLELASHIKDLKVRIPEEKEKLANAFQYIVEGSMFCASQLNSGKFCSFLKSSINSDTLSGIRSKISGLYQDLNLTVNKEMLKGQPVILPLSQAEYPKNAVGIEEQLEAVNKLLNMETTEDCSSIVVLIWGFGGIGKTTLAQAVVSKIDRSRYNYARIILDEVSENNKYKYTEMQQHILQDAFPNYKGGIKIELRDSDDGKDKLREAFSSEGNKPVFLYIDNALHKKDLEQLLPEDLGCLPQHSRILITSRTKEIVDMLEERGFHDRIKDYPVETLSDNDAMQVLCKDNAIRDRIKDDLQNIVNVCKGIPLVLTIVGAKLRK
ncbi:TMV resistance protein N [Cryptomeria japonica]|uniref:TMV resistance protein N n=1 Tax=Cryptomeria japonica TaxID=3369 RepID=UPI0027DAA8B1|nr:TMV resistance protein N [Cryptomeria japonica]